MSQVDYVRTLEDGLAAADSQIQLLKVERDWFVARLNETVEELEKRDRHTWRLAALECVAYVVLLTVIVFLLARK